MLWLGKEGKRDRKWTKKDGHNHPIDGIAFALFNNIVASEYTDDCENKKAGEYIHSWVGLFNAEVSF